MLHETTQRRVCRFAFLAGCIVPTLLVLVFASHVWRPGYAREWEAPLGQILDCNVTIHHVRVPRPGIAEFKRLELLDPETNAVLATLEDVMHEMRHGRDRVSISRATLSCSMGAEIGDQIERLLRNIACGETELAIDELALLYGGAAWNLSNVHGQLSANDVGRRIHLWSGDSERGLRLLIERNRQRDPPATLVRLQTGSESLPCLVLACWDRFDQLGPQAKFQGRIEVIASRDFTEGALTGRFSQLVNAPIHLDVSELRWGGGANPLVGSVESGPVEVLLAQLRLHDDSQPASTQSGDVAWELGPMQSWPRVADRTAPGQRLLK